MILPALITGGATLITLVAFAVLVAGVHSTDRRMSLRDTRAGHAEAFARRVLGVYVRQQAVPPGPSAGVTTQPPSQLPEGPQAMDRHITVLTG